MTKPNEHKIPNLTNLTFRHESFIYAGKHYSYSEIEHINYTADQTKYRVNFIPFVTTYRANLLLKLSGRRNLTIAQEIPWFASQKRSYLAVAKAAAIFSKITFSQRVKFYANALDGGGAIAWGNYQITREGDVSYKHERVFNIKDGTYALLLTPFSLVLRKKNKTQGERLKAIWRASLKSQSVVIETAFCT